MRKSDIAVRWGGEEFVVVLNNCGLEEARQIVEKILQCIAHGKPDVEGKRLALTVSIGLSQFSGHKPTEQTFSRAHAGLYLAKQGGRHRIGVAPAPAPTA